MKQCDYTALLSSYYISANDARKSGQWMKAARILREALRECEEVGEIHRGLVIAANDLAAAFMSQQKFDEAEMLYRAVLEVREKMFGTTHPDVVDSLRRLSVLQIVSFRAETKAS